MKFFNGTHLQVSKFMINGHRSQLISNLSRSLTREATPTWRPTIAYGTLIFSPDGYYSSIITATDLS